LSAALDSRSAGTHAAPDALEALFNPRSIAIVGASPNSGSITGQPVHHLLERRYGGRIYPVNPKFDDIAGLRCYASVSELPEAPELAVLVIAASRVPQTLAECARKGVKAAIVVSSGFAESGEGGRSLQAEVQRIARDTGLRVLGPNCQGMLNVTDGVCAGFGPVLSPEYGVPAGSLGFITQSGGFGFGVVNLVAQQGIGFRRIVSTGNECDLTTADFIEHFIAEPGTRVIAAYLEGLRDGRRLARLARRALEADKPLLVWKVGRTATGQRAASSHTASLAGDAAVASDVLRQMGAIEIEDADDLADRARVLQKGKRAGGTRVAIFSASGGAGVLAADECERAGLDVPPLSDACRAALAAVAPALGSLQNPVDVMGRIYDEPEHLERALAAVAADPGIDAIVVINPLRRGERAANLARAIAKVDAATGKPLLVSWAARRDFAADAFHLLADAGVPCFETPVRCVRALGALARYSEARRRALAATAGVEHASKRAEALAILRSAPGEVVAEHAAKRVLALYGIRTTMETLAQDAAAACAAAEAIGYPVALKVQSPDIAHKTEAGAVRLALGNADEVRRAFEEVTASARRHVPDARIEGVLVQAMIAGGTEAIAGVVSDAAWGPVVMYGAGGIHAEVMRDVAFRIPPLARDDALAMIAQTRHAAILAGARGRARSDLGALADALVRLSHLALDLGADIAELDVNPLAVLPDGQGAVALDALIAKRNTQPGEER
jgi:acyl-CoA synthetase (NDP forming)